MKGADVAMATIVQYNDWLEEEVTLTLDYLYIPLVLSRENSLFP